MANLSDTFTNVKDWKPANNAVGDGVKNTAYIAGVRVRAVSSKNLEIDDNEFMNLTQSTPIDIWPVGIDRFALVD